MDRRTEVLCPLPRDDHGRPIYFPGDIVGVNGQGFVQGLSRTMIEPPTPLFHFLLIGRYIESEDDYEILESIGKGVAIGRLSWYDGDQYEVLRVNERYCSALGLKATEAASKFGRMPYDYALFLKFFSDFVRHSFDHLKRGEWPPKMRPSDFRLIRDAAFICTEFVVATWDLVGVRILNPGDAPVPAAFVLASHSGRIIQVGFHDGNPNHARREYGLHIEHKLGEWTPRKGTRVPLHRRPR